jgi:CRISPR-associated endonuclease/helicase Cas3
MSRAERLREMERLYVDKAYTDIEMAEKLDVDRITVYKDRALLESEVTFIEVERGRWKIDRTKYLSAIRLSLSEALALYLPARRAARQTLLAQPHVANALEKLAVALKQPMTERLVKAANVILAQAAMPERVAIMETVTRGWVERVKIRIAYRGLRARQVGHHLVSPYLIEPSLWSDGAYVIGHSDYFDDVAVFKIERIEQATLTRDSFAIPEKFDEQALLRYAWGIWRGAGEPERVVLRFAPGEATRRIKESIWHPQQEPIQDLPNGGCIWAARIAEWQEMVPWIRGWGADVEVMETKELREELMREAKRLARVYQIGSVNQSDSTSRVLRLWGKTARNNQNPNQFHPVVFHMLDVGNIARELLSERASPRWRNALVKTLNADADTLIDWLPYLIALHDIGKISAAFQSANKQQTERLKHEGFSFDSWLSNADVSHSTISQIYVDGIARVWSEAIGGHHGHFLHPDNDIKSAQRKLASEPAEWQTLRQNADAILRRWFLKRDLTQLPGPSNLSTATMAMTGFMILCDWLGSDERYFKPTPDAEIETYAETSRRRAEQAMCESGLLVSTTSDASTNTATLFDDLGTLRSLQLAIDTIPIEILQSPSLTIIEAPTGEGKTEAALALAHRIAHITGTDELYYALPTMATSNQMFSRLQTHLQKRLGLDAAIKLVHGQAYLMEDELRAETPVALMQPLENGEHFEANESVEWFNSKKRALLAPFGVGTIDQAELAALNVKHAALRMMGLVGKVVIVDEVHAYDTYMTTIVERLLRWLATMNTSVILLSATLPKSRREQLAKTYARQLDLTAEQSDAYPGLLVLSANGTHHASPQVWQPNRIIELRQLHWGDDDARAKAEWLVNAVANGGCVCWITNTVKRSQRIFAELQNITSPGIDLDLLHSQFPLDERQHREDALNKKYGRVGNRPARGIVVGTQVLEQSLDLDFDVMVSDLAPIDLLLQRAGRLHRHTRERPNAHDTPRLYLNFQLTPEGDLKLGTDRRIYAEFIIRATHRALAQRTHIQLPNDYRVLIESVYTDQEPASDDPLRGAWDTLQSDQDAAMGKAKERLLPLPHPRDSFAKNAAMRVKFEEDENRADWIVAQTRLGEPTLNIIPLEREGDFAKLPNADKKLDVNVEASYDLQRALLRRNLRISHRDAMAAIQVDAENQPVRLFTDSKLLKGYYPLWLVNGKAEFKLERGKLCVTLDPQLGLLIEKEVKPNGETE